MKSRSFFDSGKSPPFAVGTALSGRPPHRSQRAGLPHWAPTSGVDAQTLCLPYPFQRTLQVRGFDVGTVSWLSPRFRAACPFRVVHIEPSGTVSGTCFAETNFPWSGRFAPRSPPTTAHRRLCSNASQLLSACPTSRLPCIAVVLLPDSQRGPRNHFQRPETGSPGSRVSNFRTCTGSRTTRG